MVKSGLIFGAIALVLILGSAVIITPFCAPCVGLFLGLAAGYVAGIYEKPKSSGEGVRKGAIAGAIAGGLGLLGGLIAGAINGAVLNPTSLNEFYKLFGLANPNFDQTSIWLLQLAGAFCIGLFNVVWMAILGVAGGALWFQTKGPKLSNDLNPPQAPIAPVA